MDPGRRRPGLGVQGVCVSVSRRKLVAPTVLNGEPALHVTDALLLFRRLGVDVPSLSAREFNLAYFQLAKRYHPDQGNRSNYELMANINVARETIRKAQAGHH